MVGGDQAAGSFWAWTIQENRDNPGAPGPSRRIWTIQEYLDYPGAPGSSRSIWTIQEDPDHPGGPGQPSSAATTPAGRGTLNLCIVIPWFYCSQYQSMILISLPNIMCFLGCSFCHAHFPKKDFRRYWQINPGKWDLLSLSPPQELSDLADGLVGAADKSQMSPSWHCGHTRVPGPMNDPNAWKEGWSAEGNRDKRECLQMADCHSWQHFCPCLGTREPSAGDFSRDLGEKNSSN